MTEGYGSGSRAGSGSGSIPLTSGSGSGRPKNVWIRICNTGHEKNGKKFYYFFWTPLGRVSDLDPHGSALFWGDVSGSRRTKMTHNNRKSTEFSCFEVLDALFWGLKASPVAWASFMEKWQFLIKKIENKISSCKFFSILGHETLDPDPGSRIRIQNLDPESGSGIRIRNLKKCWIWIRIRIKSMRIRNPAFG